MVKDLLFLPGRIVNRIRLVFFPSVKIGKGCRMNGVVTWRGRGRVTIGDRVTINSSRMANLLGSSGRTTLCAMRGAEVRIGNDVGISGAVIAARESIVIEDHVLIGADVKIMDNDFHSLDAGKRNTPEDIPAVRPVCIRSGAFIGAYSIILKGVTVGHNSIVGAGSVVTKSIPDGEIWAGNPAKFIKRIEN